MSIGEGIGAITIEGPTGIVVVNNVVFAVEQASWAKVGPHCTYFSDSHLAGGGSASQECPNLRLLSPLAEENLDVISHRQLIDVCAKDMMRIRSRRC